MLWKCGVSASETTSRAWSNRVAVYAVAFFVTVLAVQLKKARAEAADASSQLQAVEKALKTLEAGDLDDIKRQYIDAVRKAAVVQVGCRLTWHLL
jgi:geranylgeranyl pyrophosphate synthase